MDAEGRRPDLSVVVCTNRSPECLGKSLEALHGQTVRDRLEVIVVDDGAPAPLGPLCGRFGARLLVHPENLGLAAARNTGWRAARAPVVAFTDDDCRPAPCWAETLLSAYLDPSVMAAGGEVRPGGVKGLLGRYYLLKPPIAPLESELAGDPSLAQRLKLYLLANVRDGARSGRREVSSLPGASMSVRRCALEAVGGFDPAIRFGGEDEDFFYRLRRELPGAKLLFEPEAQMEHDFSGGTVDMLRRARSYGRGNARNFVKHPDWGPTLFPVPLAFLALVAAGSRRHWLLLAAALLPMAASPRFTIKALRQRSPGLALLAWLQLLEEAASDVGFVSGYFLARRQLGAAQ